MIETILTVVYTVVEFYAPLYFGLNDIIFNEL